MPAPPRAFLTYSHDSNAHRERTLDRLRAAGAQELIVGGPLTRAWLRHALAEARRLPELQDTEAAAARWPVRLGQ